MDNYNMEQETPKGFARREKGIEGLGENDCRFRDPVSNGRSFGRALEARGVVSCGATDWLIGRCSLPRKRTNAANAGLLRGCLQ